MLVQRALSEDLVSAAAGLGDRAEDVTTAATVPEEATASARIQAKEAGVAAGLAVAGRVFRAAGEPVSVTWAVEDGARVEAGDTVGQVDGGARPLLVAERAALNFMQRMSGIATATRRMVERARPHGAEILDTRKTAPGLRALDKWAVRLGGGTNHRLGLHDLILIKDNHLAAAGGVRPALEEAHRYCEKHDAGDLQIELEARTLDEVRAALDAAGEAASDGCGPDIVLLDNMARRTESGEVDATMLRKAVERIDGRFRTEASGNVTPQTVEAIAKTGVDAISSGALTHSVRALDLSMRLRS
ncbi:MAG: nicotinate-nucleotide diphosphorylase (carboxylating) [Bacteroidetes bacterium QS_7_67_15]|nr:MAG: nicotinate-nucleotide diphosphorylase (carboxylating) [Bacteroidetes bacterium QS_7_67_15]